MKEPVSIHLDSEHVILRSIGDEEAEPAILSGTVVLDLSERTDIKDISLVFSGRAHVTYSETSGSYKTHTIDQPVFYHDHSFLPTFGTRSSAPSSGFHTPLSRQSSNAAVSSLGDHPALSGIISAGNAAIASGSSSSYGAQEASRPSHQFPLGASTSSSKHSSSKDKDHSTNPHTINAGIHTFPFAFHVPGTLPASVRINNATSTIEYRLKATVLKAGVFGGKWTYKKPVTIIRGLIPDAAEYNQTLEIENTWPGKIMYNLTLPHKAYCAGERIPVALKFTPIAKGVRVTQLVTSIKEHLTVMTKNNTPHNTARDIVVKKHNFYPRSALPHTPDNYSAGAHHAVSVPPSRAGSHTDLASLANQRLNLEDHPAFAGVHSGTSSRGRSGHQTPEHGLGRSGHHTPEHTYDPRSIGGFMGLAGSVNAPGTHSGVHSGQSSAGNSRVHSRANSPERVYYGRNVNDPDYVGSVADDGAEDVDVDAVVEIQIPRGAAPSHNLEPLLISHKIKWSAFIRNLDGHTSELRCALPIHILSPVLAEEARLASSGTRSLLFGPSGVLVPAAEGIQQVDLPAYSEHVRDRVANIDSASYIAALSSTGYGAPVAAAASTAAATQQFVRSPWASPVMSPETGGQSDSTGPSSPSNGYFLDSQGHQNRPINWADSELLNTLSMSLPGQHPSHHSSQASSKHTSPANSRPGSRPNSRPSSRPSSRASSPVRGESTNHLHPVTEGDGVSSRNQASSAPTGAHDAMQPPSAQRTHSSTGGGFFSSMNLAKKPLRPFTSLTPSSQSSSSLSLSGQHIGGNARTPGLEDHRTSSHSSLAGLFHRSTSSRSHSGAHLAPDSQHSSHRSTPQHSPPLSRTTSRHPTTADAVPGPSSGAATGDIASQTIAALEAHQERQAAKGKGRELPGRGLHRKGKKKEVMFASMHADEDEEEDDQHHPDDSGRRYTPTETPPHEEDEENQTGSRYLSQVPSYEIARRGFLGGGITPLDVTLPSYDESEHRSRPSTPVHGSFTSPSTVRPSTSAPTSERHLGS